MRDPSGKTISYLSNHETTLLAFFSVQGSSQTAVGVLAKILYLEPTEGQAFAKSPYNAIIQPL
jgi:hypothetical protein